jgi:hypothetical protein
MLSVRKKGDRLKKDHPRYPIPGDPHWKPAIQYLCIVCQNVAGLWLKYGVKSLKIETSWPSEIPFSMRRFIDNNR